MNNSLEHLPSKWRARARGLAPYAKPIIAGGLFGAGALVLVRLFGPRVARATGEAGGEGFAQGVAKAEAALSQAAGRGSRFG